MGLKKEQAKKYIEEAELSFYVAESLYNRAKDSNLDLWAHVIKNCYDAIEQAISAAIASEGEKIPREHPRKVYKFLGLFKVSQDIKKQIFFWMGERASTQYVDLKEDVVSVPHEMFSEEDAKKALDEAREIIDVIKNIIKEN